MSATYFLSCKCGTYKARLDRSAHRVLVSDSTGFFERVAAETHNMGWSLFADGFIETSIQISGIQLSTWILGIDDALRTHAGEAPTIKRIVRKESEEETCAYLKISDSFWMVEAHEDTLVAKPIHAAVVAEREQDSRDRAIVVTGTLALFPDQDPDRPLPFRPSTSQLSVVFDGTALRLVDKPIGLTFSTEISAITALAEHAVEMSESIESYCV